MQLVIVKLAQAVPSVIYVVLAMKNSKENVPVIYFALTSSELSSLACEDLSNCEDCKAGPDGFGCYKCAIGYYLSDLECLRKKSLILKIYYYFNRFRMLSRPVLCMFKPINML